MLILDQTSWHNISLLHLPPYSPELNPVEQVWHFLK
ncbi:MAG: transposase [Candidatus Melainabacteria bacterium]|nr:transposase [Candidatus Melainabacteria bacterium]